MDSEKDDIKKDGITVNGAAGVLFKRYGSARKLIRAMEKYRPSLLQVIGAEPGKYRWEDYESFLKRLEAVRLPKEDRELLEEFIESAEIVNIVEVAVRERIGGKLGKDEKRIDEYEDMFLNTMTTQEIMKKHGISERTVRNIKKKGMEAIEAEIRLRIGCGRKLSSIY